ncbi:hypothetical protein D3C76_1136760 [compost metagenome]
MLLDVRLKRRLLAILLKMNVLKRSAVDSDRVKILLELGLSDATYEFVVRCRADLINLFHFRNQGFDVLRCHFDFTTTSGCVENRNSLIDYVFYKKRMLQQNRVWRARFPDQVKIYEFGKVVEEIFFSGRVIDVVQLYPDPFHCVVNRFSVRCLNHATALRGNGLGAPLQFELEKVGD